MITIIPNQLKSWQGCQERHDPWQPKPPISAFRSNDYGYTRLTAHNGTHLELEQISDDKVLLKSKGTLIIIC